MSHAVDIAPGIDFRDKAEALEGFEVRRVIGDLIEGGIATKGRFLLGQEMDGREIRMRHGINPFRGDYITDAPRGARPAQGGSRMKKPFHERFWWLPIAIDAVAIIVALIALSRP